MAGHRTYKQVEVRTRAAKAPKDNDVRARGTRGTWGQQGKGRGVTAGERSSMLRRKTLKTLAGRAHLRECESMDTCASST